LRLLFARVAGPIASEAMPGCFWRGLRLTAIDGSTLDVPNSPANRTVFDGPSNDAGPGAFPQVRLLMHAECGAEHSRPFGIAHPGLRTADAVAADPGQGMDRGHCRSSRR
jgi:hypothetical protein